LQGGGLFVFKEKLKKLKAEKSEIEKYLGMLILLVKICRRGFLS